MAKKKFLLIVPSLKQGGFQRVCARTALLLKEHFEVYVLVFDGTQVAYPLDEIAFFDVDVKAKRGILNKFVNVFKRISKVKKIKRDNQINISYSFGMSANLINVLTKVNDKIWCGMRSYIDLETRTLGLVCKKADLVISCSRVLEKYIRDRYPLTKTVTVYNPFDVQGLINEAEEDIEQKDKVFFEDAGPIIAAMGREDVLKGYWHLIKAFSKVEVPEARLCIIGNGEFTKEKQLVRELGLEKRVLFTGGKTNPFSYLKYADVYVMSSTHEGFPNALVEAMVLGIPVISTNCETGPAEILADDYEEVMDLKDICNAEYGVLVPVMTKQPNYEWNVFEIGEELLAKAMTRMLTDSKLRENYILREKARVEKFNTKKYVETFIDLGNNN